MPRSKPRRRSLQGHSAIAADLEALRIVSQQAPQARERVDFTPSGDKKRLIICSSAAIFGSLHFRWSG